MRLFIAVWPPAEVLAAVEALPRPERAGVRWTRPDQWHVTLRFLGEVPDEQVDEVGDALAGAGLASTTAVLGPRTTVLGRRVLVAPVAGLDDVAAAVIEATARLGEPPESRRFTGHLTLARTRGPDLRPLAGAPIEGRWDAGEVVVVRSRLRREGARYEDVRTVPLR